jgi:hypothetical protein
MSSTSEDEATIHDSNENTWQKVKNTKGRKVNQPDSHNLTLTSKYSQLAVEDDGNITIQATENKIPKPPPIFVYGVTNYLVMVHNMHNIVKIELWEPPTKQFCPKCQSPRVLPSSQSTWSIAAPNCIGSRSASRQSIRDGHSEAPQSV